MRPRVLAEALAATLTARAETKSLAAEIRIGALPDAAVGDPVLLRAAVENLIDNAVKFTERGSVGLDVTAEPAARNRARLIFAVNDSGIGLAPAEIKRLFRPFTQASGEIAGRFGGAGLGLVFVKRVAQAMRGKVTVESKPGAGSIFRLAVTVEAVAPESGETNISATGVRPGRTRALRILCAEDNPYGRVILNTILTELGHKVDFAGSGEAAVEAVARGGYDLVLLDVILPGVDGIEATRRIRAREGAPHTPIIGISGRASPSDEANARAAGMDAYVMKPVSPSRLAEVIAAIMAR
jgi:CheY-like chemotaxis protein